MFWNYFTIAFRNSRKFIAHSFLTISGMVIGMACTILLLLTAYNEWSYDRSFKNANQIYRILEKQNVPGGAVAFFAISPGTLSNKLKKAYPEIIRASRYEPHAELRLKMGEQFQHEKAVAAVDTDFFRMFDIQCVEGDLHTALSDPHNIVLTEEMAHKYFGTGNPIGKTLLESLGYLETVTAVVKKPSKSHLQFDFLVPIELLKERGAPINDWEFRCYNYIELAKGTVSNSVEEKIRDFLKKNIEGSQSELILQNIKKIHLFSSGKYTYDISGHGDITYVRIMSLIAIFILLIACINFMNLSTAQSARRAKEIGVRRVAGATKRKIVVQFLGESMLIVFVAFVIAMILVELMLPGFNILTGKHLAVDYRSAGLYVFIITIVLVCGLLGGSYPALYLSSLSSLDTMKGIITRNPGNALFRRVLVIFQFSLSVLLIIGTLIVEKQLTYMQNQDLGFNRENIVYFMFPAAPWDPKLQTVKKELCNNPDITSVTRVFYNYENPLNVEGTSGGYTWTGKKVGEDVLFYEISADEDYAKTFQLKLKQGRFFSSAFPTDASAVVINETAAKIMGFNDPVGENVTTPQDSRLGIIGVVKDFHFKPLHYKIEPLLIRLGTSNTFFIRLTAGNITSPIESIKKIYNSFKPDLPIEFHFLDEDFEKLYQTEQRTGKTLGYFTLLAIIISCLGLIGLSTFIIDRRTKEIGIRKVNGANSNEIYSLMLKEYVILAFISYTIAGPLAWVIMHRWLENYAYRIYMNGFDFALAGVLVLIIILLSVGFQSYRAASKNPVEALRYE